VGPNEIGNRAPAEPAGTRIRSAADVKTWIKASGQRLEQGGYVTATYIVNQVGELLVADRRSEHVACAGRLPVQSAGEITFVVEDSTIEIESVSNQSTGYCPEPESWSAVAASLITAGFKPPAGFSPACTFRRCAKCARINLVKHGVFECALCGSELPTEYNCQK